MIQRRIKFIECQTIVYGEKKKKSGVVPHNQAESGQLGGSSSL